MDEFTTFQPVDAVVDGAYGSGMAAESSVMPVGSLYYLAFRYQSPYMVSVLI